MGELIQELPSQIKIGPVLYEVKEVDRLANDGVWGQIVYADSVIEMNPAIKAQHRTITLWHEIFHGMLLQGGIREHDERILDVLAHGITAVLQDNPELTK